MARTIADLAGAESTQVAHVAEAMQYRRTFQAAPLDRIALVSTDNMGFTRAMGGDFRLFLTEITNRRNLRYRCN